jgi:hypothetical protein
MKINPNRNVDTSLNPETQAQSDSGNKVVMTSKGIATAKDAFKDASSEDNRLTNIMGAINNNSGVHNTISTRDSNSDSTAVQKTSDSPVQPSEQDTGWFPGNIFKVDSDTNVKISTGEERTVSRKDDDD